MRLSKRDRAYVEEPRLVRNMGGDLPREYWTHVVRPVSGAKLWTRYYTLRRAFVMASCQSIRNGTDTHFPGRMDGYQTVPLTRHRKEWSLALSEAKRERKELNWISLQR